MTIADPRNTRRRELGAFLKSRRAKIAPADVGLPAGPRRRTPGLRREELAQLAGVGVTWYTWLEQGRDINVSVQVLDAVARALRLDAAEHGHLYRLADVPVAPALADEGPLPEELQIILDQLDPLPSALISARYDVLAYNRPYAALCPTFGCRSSNILRTVFTMPACCNPYGDAAEDLARMVGYLRGGYVKHLHDPEWNGFIDELSSASSLFATLWARNDVAVPAARTKTIRNVATGDVEMYRTYFSVPMIAGAWVQILTPVDAAAWSTLHALLATPDAERRRTWDEHAALHEVSAITPSGV
jgi:transcriptional regulator with XRE-family HTH domain